MYFCSLNCGLEVQTEARSPTWQLAEEPRSFRLPESTRFYITAYWPLERNGDRRLCPNPPNAVGWPALMWNRMTMTSPLMCTIEGKSNTGLLDSLNELCVST